MRQRQANAKDVAVSGANTDLLSLLFSFDLS